MPAESRENPLLKIGNSDAFFREKYLTKNKIPNSQTGSPDWEQRCPNYGKSFGGSQLWILEGGRACSEPHYGSRREWTAKICII